MNRKQVLTGLIVLLLLAGIPLAIYVSQQRTQTRSGASFDFAGYDVVCLEDNTEVLRVSDPFTSVPYDEASGSYTLTWFVENLTDEEIVLHAENYACRCPEPNAQSTPQELLDDPSAAYPGRMCIGSWPLVTASDPLQASEVLSAWNYCLYDYNADPQLISTEKQQQALSSQFPQTAAPFKRVLDNNGQEVTAGGPIFIGPRETFQFDHELRTENAEVNHCGSFQTTWIPLAVERGADLPCTIRRLPGENIATVDITITGTGQVDGENYADWRPEGSTSNGEVCQPKGVQEPVCGNGVCEPGENNTNCPQDCPDQGAKNVCDGLSCRECVGAECDGLSMSMCSSNEDCYETICVANNSCQKASLDEVNRRINNNESVITCEANSECALKTVCVNDSCEVQRGVVKPEDTVCRTEDNNPTTGRNEQCIEYHFVCENNACVQKEGDKESTCDPNDANACLAACLNETCVDRSKLPAGTPVISCSTDSLGQKVAECQKTVCDTVAETCTITTGTEDPREACTSDVECGGKGEPKLFVCENEACIVTTNPSDTRDRCTPADPNNPGLTDIECQKTVCDTANETCSITTGVEDTRQACSGDVECQKDTPETHYACVDLTCDLIQGPPGPDTEICTSHLDCRKSYNACREYACVEILGKAPTPQEIAEACARSENDPGCIELCNPQEINVCLEPEDPKTGVDGAALAISVMVMLMIGIGLKLAF